MFGLEMANKSAQLCGRPATTNLQQNEKIQPQVKVNTKLTPVGIGSGKAESTRI
jgi:hypothetical protein